MKTVKFISGFCVVKLIEENFISLNPSSGESMLPTIQPQNDWLLIWNFLRSYSFLDNLMIGDVVVAMKPTSSNTRVCKRILAKEGDIILLDPASKSKLSTVAYYLNNLEKDNCFEHKFIRVPKGHVWLGGDNTEFSVDSRNYGFVPIGLIEGKVIYHINFNKSFYKFEKLVNSYKDI
ncbi:LexA/Signal peptidase [Hanseniaspora valbyensis NRRL Y-1626]|uniref:Mitochondrial inner membrane protease subunit n=1 Tax=Hanseniaspora valbyensis NRRL Y-1626 TaxID=766949 RepID=A0A1B7TDJ3_9ASCO|nr:LexA/Signal peptidase [Hanseniaspora valbyensis NRRL Y-1626]